MNNIGFREFNCFLLKTLKEKLPESELFIVNGGDYLQEVVMEIRQAESRFKYKPYELYCEGCRNDSFEEVIEKLINDIVKEVYSK